MNVLVIFASCFLLGVYGNVGPDFAPSSAGFHRKRLRHTDGYRLPGTARPLKYDLTLEITPADSQRYIKGEVVITMDVDSTAANGTYSVELNSDIEMPYVYNDTFIWNGHMSCKLDVLSPKIGQLKIDCPKPINGTNQTLKIVYEPRFATYDMKGAYVVNYSETGQEKWMIATQFEQGYARRLMPCFDEPEYKAPIQLTLKTNVSQYNFSDWLSNTKEISRTVENNIVTSIFEPTPNMSTYLLAFVVTEGFRLVKNASYKSDYEFGVFARPTVEDYLSIALENGPLLIDLMSNYTDMHYTKLGNSKMTLAAIPEFAAGAMENWGLITVREQFLVDEGAKRTTRRDRQLLIEILAHEITHQWFGDYVTMDWWSDTWLNEGFAEYFQYDLTDEISSEFQMADQFVVKELQAALKTDAQPDSIPLSNNASDVTTEEDFLGEFNAISYSKGASILRMVRYAMTQVWFDVGLDRYLSRYAYGNPTSANLIQSFQDSLPVGTQLDLKTLLHSWIYHPGYPILNVAVNNTIVTIKATKFSTSWNEIGAENSTWWIPLSYATRKTDFSSVVFEWIQPEKVKDFSVDLYGAGWIVFNVQAAGYFRVNYDSTLWNRLVNLLNDSATLSDVPVTNRAQLLDDAFNVAKSYQGDEETIKYYYLKAFNLTEYLQFEREYIPWYTYFVEMQWLMERIQDEATLSGLKDKILKVVSPQLKIPSDTDKNVTHTEILRRNLLLAWACRLGHEKCIEWAQKQFESYLQNRSSIDNNYRDVIVCTSLRSSNQSYERVYDILVDKATLPFEQNDLIKSLSCLQDELTINKTLQTTVNFGWPPYPRMFYDTLLTNIISGGTDKVLAALKFLMVYDYSIQQYWLAVEDRAVALKKVAEKIYTQQGVDLLNRYIREQQHDGDKSDMVEAAKAGLEVAQSNLLWLSKYGDLLKSVILYDGGSPPPTTTTTEGPATGGASKNIFSFILVIMSMFAYLLGILRS